MAREDLISKASHWPSNAVFIDFSHADPDGGGESNPATAKQLACTRCHAQKIRCVRRTGDACERCIAANHECVNRHPQRMGRPTDNIAGGDQIRRGMTRRAANARRHYGAGDEARRRRRKSSVVATVDLSPAGDTTTSTMDSATAASTFTPLLVPVMAPGFENWLWPNPQESTAPDFSSIGLLGTDDSSTTSPNTNLASITYPISNGADAPAHILSNLDNMLNGSFDFDCLPDQNSASCDTEVDDPIELLTALHLELYQCLNVVKIAEKAKKQRLGSSIVETQVSADPNWSERVFETAERFVDALTRYVELCPSSNTRSSDDTLVGDKEEKLPLQVDAATGLMIVSCCTRMLQIFEVVIFVVETFTSMNCPSSYVQIGFGKFRPKASKLLHAQLLGQYVLHLLDGMSEAAGRAVESNQMYAQAIANIRLEETKLRQRILKTLH